MDGKCLTRKQVAERLGVSVQTVDRAIKAKKIKAVKIGHLVRVPEGFLQEYLERGGARAHA